MGVGVLTVGGMDGPASGVDAEEADAGVGPVGLRRGLMTDVAAPERDVDVDATGTNRLGADDGDGAWTSSEDGGRGLDGAGWRTGTAGDERGRW